LQVSKNRNRFALRSRGSAQRVNIARVIFMFAMGEIQPRYIHSSAQEPVNHRRRAAGRADGANNF
jgi:hypothetical protein